MSRTNIFELLKQNNSIEKDGARIIELATIRKSIQIKGAYYSYSLEEFVNDYCFSRWANRGRCLDLTDFFDNVGIVDGDLSEYEVETVDEFLNLIEICYNLLYMANNYPDLSYKGIVLGKELEFLRDIMDECLSELNQAAYYNPELEQCIVSEASPQVTAAAEASDPEIAWEIIRYNHRQLAGDLAKKKTILKVLGDELEGRKKEIMQINNSLYNCITGALNNLNIRHNNISPANKSQYKQMTAQMPTEELEQHYDDLYQLILLAILEIDNVERQRKMKELIQKVNAKEE